MIVLDHDGAFCDRTRSRGVPRRDHRHRAVASASRSTHRQRSHPFARQRDHRRHAGRPGVLERYGDRRRRSRAGTATHHAVRNVLTDSIAPDPAVARLVREAVDRVAPIVNRRIATIAETLERDEPQYPLGNLIADAMRDAGQGDVAVMNNGGIRTALAPAPRRTARCSRSSRSPTRSTASPSPARRSAPTSSASSRAVSRAST